jgi:signal transduction histidine kinase
MICYLYTEPTYFFFTSDLPQLLYYTHIPVTLVALAVGFFVFFKDKSSLLNQLLFLISICFSIWTFINLIAWTNVNGDLIAFIWTFYGTLSALLSLLSVYFVYVFLFKKDVSFLIKNIFLVLLLPVLLFSHTDLSISGFDLANCDAFAFEGIGFKIYYTLLGVLAMVWIYVLLIQRYKTASQQFKKQIVLMGAGIETFLFLFFTVTVSVTYLVNIGILNDSRLEMYGLVGMLIFMIFIGILIVKFEAFKIKLAAPIALVASLWALVSSLLFVREIETVQVIVSVTLLLLFIFGYALIKSIMRGVKHREEIEKLAGKLKKANSRLKELDKLKSEFVSIASHQLRSPLTAVSGYTSLLEEGAYGKLPAKAKEPIERISMSVKMMAQSIEEYLNVSRIESGNMKYNLSDFNLRDQVEITCDSLRREAIKRGLIILFKNKLTSRAVVNADLGKVQQILHNLIDNSIKYTKKGTITILVKDDVKKKRIYVEISDTGVGMSEQTLDTIFQKFERGNDANRVNIKGTGLGLYVALRMSEAMGGTIEAYSEGEGKGSKFVFELPLAM